MAAQKNTRGAGGAKGSRRNTDTAANSTDAAKVFANLQARAALAGHELHRSPSGAGFYVSRWGMTRYFPTLAQVQAFIAQIGGKP